MPKAIEDGFSTQEDRFFPGMNRVGPQGATLNAVQVFSLNRDTKVHGSIRAQSAACVMGQAAGTAAAQSIRTGQPANDLDTGELVKTLREEGANLPQLQLARSMTRH